MSSAKEKKARYFDKFVEIFEKHTQVLIVQCDNVGSHHMQRIRKSLRGEATILMGKNVRSRSRLFRIAVVAVSCDRFSISLTSFLIAL